MASESARRRSRGRGDRWLGGEQGTKNPIEQLRGRQAPGGEQSEVAGVEILRVEQRRQGCGGRLAEEGERAGKPSELLGMRQLNNWKARPGGRTWKVEDQLVGGCLGEPCQLFEDLRPLIRLRPGQGSEQRGEVWPKACRRRTGMLRPRFHGVCSSPSSGTAQTSRDNDSGATEPPADAGCRWAVGA